MKKISGSFLTAAVPLLVVLLFSVPSVVLAATSVTIAPGSQTPSPVTVGSAATYTITVTQSTNNGTAAPQADINLNTTGLATGVTANISPACQTLAQATLGSPKSVTFTLTLSTSAATPVGTDTFSIGGSRLTSTNATCSGSTFGLTQPATVNATLVTQAVPKINTTTTITSDTPDPSDINAAYAVAVSVSRASGVNTPIGTVTVSDGAATCTVSSLTGSGGTSTGSCNITSTTAGAKTLTATYNGDANFNTSSGTTAHTVNQGTIVGDGSAPANKTVGANAANKAVSAFTLSTTAGTDTVTGLVVTGTNTANVASGGVRIYRDNGTTANEWDASDTLVASESFSGGSATFSGLSIPVTTTALQYLVTYDIVASPTNSQTLTAVVTGVTATNTVVNNDTTDATLTIDSAGPVIAQVTAVPNYTTLSKPKYWISTNEGGTITYGGDCGANGGIGGTASLSAASSSAQLTLPTLTDGLHTNCTVTMTDAAGNVGNTLAVNSFTIDRVPPSGGLLSYANATSTALLISLTYNPGSDPAGTGIETAQIQRREGTLNVNTGACTGFGAFANLTVTPTDSAGVYDDEDVVSGKCYQYQYVTADFAGNSITYAPVPTATAKVVIQYTITTAPGVGGTISPIGGLVAQGSTPAYAIIPNTGFVVSSVSMDAAVQGAINAFTFPAVTADHTLSATFDGGWSAPSTNPATNGTTGATNAYTSNNSYATFGASSNTADYGGFNLNIPVGASITNIQVALEGNTTGRDPVIFLSKNNGASYTASQGLNFGTPEVTLISSGLWSTTWSASDFSNANFRVRVGVGTNGTFSLDQLQVKVTYTPDTTAPTGGSINYVNGYRTSSSVPVTYTLGTDTGAGIASSTGKIQRSQATLTNGVCDSFGPMLDLVTEFDGSYTDTSVSNGNCYKYQYVISDNASPANTATYTSANVVMIDTAAPVITIDSYNTAPTNLDVTVTASTNEGTLNTTSHIFSANGSFDFVATDPAGNAATSTVTITNIDKSVPTITVLGSDPVTIAYGATYSDAGAAATDVTPGDLTSSIVTLNPVNTSLVGDYTITYNVTDAAGNAAEQKTRTVHVVKATQTISVTQSAQANAVFGETFAVSASASSNLPVDITTSGGCTNVLDSVTMTSGTTACVVHYNQVGDGNYEAAPEIIETTTANKKAQTITFATLSDKTFGASDFSVTASSDSNLPVHFTASDNCTVTPDGSTLHIVNAGSCTVTASQVGDENFSAASDVSRTFAIAKADTTVTWANPSDITYGTALSATELNATASVAGTFAYTPDIGTVLNAGSAQTLHVDFTPTDATDYNPSSADVSINVLVKGIIVTPAAGQSKVYGDLDPVLTYASSESVAFTGALSREVGEHASTYAITIGDLSAGENYSLTLAPETFAITKATPTIVVTPYAAAYDAAAHTASGTAKGVHGEDLLGLDLSATTHTAAGTYPTDAWTFTDSTGNYSNANGTVSDSISAISATIDVQGYSGAYDGSAHGATGTAKGVNDVDLSAGLSFGSTYTDVPGGIAHWTFHDPEGNYSDASGDVDITIGKAAQSINVTTPAPATAEFGSVFTVAATAPGGEVAISVSGGCSISSGTVTMTSGTTACVIAFDQAGNGNYSAALTVTETVDATQKAQAIMFAALSDKTFNDADFSVTAIADSGLDVTFSSASTACTVSANGLVHIVSAGTCSIDADQAGDANYSAATTVTQGFSIGKAGATVTISNTAQNFDGTPKTVTVVTNPLGLTVDVTYDGSGLSATNVGSHPVVATINDTNYSGSANDTLVISDNTAPVLSGTPADISIEATSASGAAVTYVEPTAQDDVDGAVTPVCVPASGSTFALGETLVTCTATDSATNASQSTFKVTVVDTTAPLITTPVVADTEAASASGAAVSYAAPTASDIVDGTDPVTCDMNSGDTFPLGLTTVHCSSTDAHSNTASATFTVKVIDTTAPPVPIIDTHPTDPTSSLLSTFTFHDTEAGVTFECAVDSDPFVICSGSFSATTIDGAHTFRVKAIDATSNASNEATFTWTVDTAGPVVAVTSPATNELTGPTGVIAYTAGDAASLNCLLDGNPLSCDLTGSVSFSSLTSGPHTFSMSGVDALGNPGNTASVTWNVDATAPVIDAQSDISYPATNASGAVATFIVSATDAVDGPVSPSCIPASGSQFAIGTTTVTCMATDAHGNAATSQFSVGVFDSSAPTITASPDQTVEATSNLGAVVTFATPTASDDVDASITVSCLPASGSQFVLGTTTVTCSATDSASNSSASHFDVGVIDSTAPVITLNGNNTINLTVGDSYFENGATSTDAVDGELPAVVGGDAVNTSVIGTYIVSYSKTDAHGNAATPVSRTVNVADKPAPILSNELSLSFGTSTATITWTTDHAATSRVVYDTVSHNPVTDPAPYYGYAFSTIEDTVLTTTHTVLVTGLTPNTSYYFRPVSHGSPEAVGVEVMGTTSEDIIVLPVAACGDGLDNDNDTFADYPVDPGCTSVEDNDETDPVSVTGTLTVQKVVVGGTKVASNFSFQVDGGIAQIFEEDGTNDITVEAGTHLVNEVNPNDGGYITTYGGDCSTNGSVTFAAHENKTCVITNTWSETPPPAKGTLKVIKIARGDTNIFSSFGFTGDLGSFSIFTFFGRGSKTFSNVDVGSYTINESAKSGWTQTSNSCVGVQVVAGQTVTCTVVNTKDAPPATGRLKVIKKTIGGNGTFAFSGDAGSFSITTRNGSGSKTISRLDPGSYSVTESVPEGWTETGNTCENVEVVANRTASCVITNTKDTEGGDQGGNTETGTIIVRKTTNPSGDTTNFHFDASYDADGFDLSDGEQNVVDKLAPGSYSVSESATDGWQSDNGVCVSSNEGSTQAPGSISLAADEVVTCSFTNTLVPVTTGTIVVKKVTVPAGDTTDFSFTASYDENGFVISGDEDGNTNVASGLMPGTYSVSEGALAQGWTQTSAVCDDESSPAAIVLTAGKTVTCTFTNTKTVTDTGSGSGNGSGSNGGGGNGPISGSIVSAGGGSIGGQVLGASTTTLPELPKGCSALLNTYMRIGRHNDASEVKKLQEFLNDKFSANLPITGFFGKLTDKAVREFQRTHAGQVLTPWGITDPTGYVFKTTQRWINLTNCSTLDIPMPELN